MPRRIFYYEFLLLWGVAVVGAMLELFLTRFPADSLASQLYIPLHFQSSVAVSIAFTAQVGLEFAVATCVGLWAAHRLGLGAPILEGCLQKKPVSQQLRSLVLPVILSALFISVFSNLPVLSALNPNQEQRAAELEAFWKTPQARQLEAALERTTPSRRITPFSRAFTYANSALSGEVYNALFMVSVFALLFRQIRKTSCSADDNKIILGGDHNRNRD